MSKALNAGPAQPTVRVIAEQRDGSRGVIVTIDGTWSEIRTLSDSPGGFMMLGALMVGVSDMDGCTRVLADQIHVELLTRLLGTYIGATAVRALAGLKALPGIDDPEEWQQAASVSLELALTPSLMAEIITGFAAHSATAAALSC